MKTLFDRTYINGIELTNRIVRSATWERMASEDGHMTEPLMKVYERLAQGAVGLIITGYAFVTAGEQPNPGMMGIYDDSFIEGYSKLTEMVHSLGSRIVLQVAYGGSQTKYNIGEREIWGPSAVTHERTGVTPKAMSRQDIDTLVNAFASAGLRAKQAGFDGVQLHAAHGYLLSQFLNPYYNRRNDSYGGAILSRARIIFEILEATREKVGTDFNILIKINCDDFTENGFTFDECQHVCRELASLGIDAIEVSGGKALKENEECVYSSYGAVIAEQVNVPVIVVGMNRDPRQLEHILNNTKIAYMAMSRPFIREPNLVKRWQEGDMTRARCISCNKCFSPDGIKCVFNGEWTVMRLMQQLY